MDTVSSNMKNIGKASSNIFPHTPNIFAYWIRLCPITVYYYPTRVNSGIWLASLLSNIFEYIASAEAIYFQNWRHSTNLMTLGHLPFDVTSQNKNPYFQRKTSKNPLLISWLIEIRLTFLLTLIYNFPGICNFPPKVL